MSSSTPDAVRAELDIEKARADTVTANLQNGTTPLSRLIITGVANTGTSFGSFTGASTLSADEIMHQTLVDGAGVTTFTKTGFLRVSIVDQGGNITDGDHYIQFGSLS